MGRTAASLAPVACVAAAIGVASCAPRAPAPPPPMPKAQDGWSVSAQPVIPAGSLLAEAMWNDPSVLRTDAGYVMYATTSVGEPWKPPVLPFRLVSGDGAHWSLSPAAPLLKAVPPYESIETPSVVQFAGRWHLFFTGVRSNPDPSPMSIGHAISDDGIRWTIDRPVLLEASGEANDWRSYLVAEPGAVVVGNRLLVYFSAVGARAADGPPQDQSIGVIESVNGVDFTAPRRVLQEDRVYSPGQGYAGYSSPAALVDNGKVHLFYSVAHFDDGADPAWRQVAIHHAVSADGIEGFAEDSRPIVNLNSAGWTSGEVIGPAPLVDGDKLRLWFGGHVKNADLGPLVKRGFQGPEFGIGEASVDINQFRDGTAAAMNQTSGSAR